MKISIARKNLFSEKSKFIVSVLGVGLSLLVILTPVGVFFGSLYPARALPEQSGADIWVVQKGSGDLFHTRSTLQSGLEDELMQIEGVRLASPLINNPTKVVIDGTKVTAAVIGFDTNTKLGSPWKSYSGDFNISNGETIIDRSFSYINNVDIGGKIEIGNKEFTVKAVSSETNVLVFQYVFVTLEDAVELLDQDNIINYYLVSIDPNSADIDFIQEEIARVVPNSDSKLSEVLADSNAEVLEISFSPILGILAVVGIFVGITVISLTISSLTSSKEREYGVLKAIGVNNRKLLGIVFEQSIITALVGYLFGVGLYYLLDYSSQSLFPQVTFRMSNEIMVYLFVVVMVMSVISSFIPIFKINSLDPSDVFKR